MTRPTRRSPGRRDAEHASPRAGGGRTPAEARSATVTTGELTICAVSACCAGARSTSLRRTLSRSISLTSRCTTPAACTAASACAVAAANAYRLPSSRGPRVLTCWLQRRPGHVGGGEPRRRRVRIGGEQRNEVRPADTGGQRHLTPEPCPELSVLGVLGVNHLDRHPHSVGGDSGVDGAHDSGAEAADDAVRAYAGGVAGAGGLNSSAGAVLAHAHFLELWVCPRGPRD